jgi:hypothetical protein
MWVMCGLVAVMLLHILSSWLVHMNRFQNNAVSTACERGLVHSNRHCRPGRAGQASFPVDFLKGMIINEER